GTVHHQSCVSVGGVLRLKHLQYPFRQRPPFLWFNISNVRDGVPAWPTRHGIHPAGNLDRCESVNTPSSCARCVHVHPSVATQRTYASDATVRRATIVNPVAVMLLTDTCDVCGSGVTGVATTVGGVLNRPVVNVTASVRLEFAALMGTITSPAAVAPWIVPLVLNVIGPQWPAPSPPTSNMRLAERRVDGSASGKSFVSDGAGPAAQPVGRDSKYATACPSRSATPTLWKSVRVGVVVFLAKDSANLLTPTGSGAPMTFSFARLGQVNREGGDMRELLERNMSIKLNHLYAAHQSPELSPVFVSAYSWTIPAGLSVWNVPSWKTIPTSPTSVYQECSVAEPFVLNTCTVLVDFFATTTCLAPQSPLPT